MVQNESPLHVVVRYKDAVTSPDINRSRIGFFPKGRYFGFDKIEDSPESGFVIRLSNQTYLNYTDEEGEQEQVGLAVTPHGLVVHFKTYWDIALDTPITDQYFVIILNAKWVRSYPGNPPYLFAKYAGLAMPENPDQHLIEPLHEVVVGIMKVKSGAFNKSLVELYPSIVPNFAWKPTPNYDDYFARLNHTNLLTKQLTHSLSTVGSEAFSNLPGVGTAMIIPDSNGVLVNLASMGGSKSVNYIQLPTEGSLSNKTRLLWIGVTGNSLPYELTLAPGGNIVITKEITVLAKDSVLLCQFHGLWYPLSHHNYYERNLDRVAFVDYQNIWTSLQTKAISQLNQQTWYYSDRLYITKSPVTSISLSSTVSINRIRFEDDILPDKGTEFTLVVTSGSGHQLQLSLQNHPYDEFVVNGTLPYDDLVGLKPGVYKFLALETYTNKAKWMITGEGFVFQDSKITLVDNQEYNPGSDNRFTLKIYRQSFGYLVKAQLIISNINQASGYISVNFIPPDLNNRKVMLQKVFPIGQSWSEFLFGNSVISINNNFPHNLTTGTYEVNTLILPD